MDYGQLTRSVWEISEDDFPADGPLAQQARFLLRYAILAPSSHNSQPWAFEVDGGRIEIHAEESRWLRQADANRRELFLSVGCALENLVVAAQHFGLRPSMDFVSTESGPSVLVDLSGDASRIDKRPKGLFWAITERRTSHSHFYDRTPDADFFDDLRGLVYDSEVQLHLVTSDSTKKTLASMQNEADQQKMQDEDYRRELSEWIGSGALGDSWPKARISQFVVKHFDIGKSEGANNAEYIEKAPAVALITTSDDTTRNRIQAGQVYERIALAAERADVATHPLSQMLEIDEYRDALAETVGVDGQCPQHFFRLGFARASRNHTPRWPLEQFLGA